MDRETTASRLKKIMAEKNLKQVDVLEAAKPFCEKYNVKLNKSDLSQFVSGKVVPGQWKLTVLGLALNVSEAWLMGYDVPAERNAPETKNDNEKKVFDNIYPIELKKYPLLGEIACGKPIYCQEDRESYVLSGSAVNADFCLKCKGDSMINARIYDGDIVFIREQEEVENGEIAAVIIDDEATLKRVYYYPEQEMVILKAENPRYADIILQKDTLNTVRILGKAVAFQSDVR